MARSDDPLGLDPMPPHIEDALRVAYEHEEQEQWAYDLECTEIEEDILADLEYGQS